MPQPIIVPQPVTSVLNNFQPVAVKEVKDLLAKLPGKHCSLDPVPTWLVKKAAPDLFPVLSLMCNASLQSAKLPASHKHAIVLPRLKKPTLDEADLNSYRPISIIKPELCFKACRTGCHQTVCGACRTKPPLPVKTVSVQTSPQFRNSCCEFSE